MISLLFHLKALFQLKNGLKICFVIYVIFLCFDSSLVLFVNIRQSIVRQIAIEMKPTIVADEMFPEGVQPFIDLDEVVASGSTLAIDLTQNEKLVHNDFFNQFDDLMDDEDLK